MTAGSPHVVGYRSFCFPLWKKNRNQNKAYKSQEQINKLPVQTYNLKTIILGSYNC